MVYYFIFYDKENKEKEIMHVNNKIIFSPGTAPEHQRLIFRGKQLEDHYTISHYKIEKDNVIHLVNRYNSG